MIKFLQMLPINAFITEHPPDLKHALITADQQPLERKLERNAQIKILIQRIVMRLERLRLRASGDMLEHRRLHLEKFFPCQKSAHRLPEQILFYEQLSRFRIHQEIQIAPTEKLLFIFQSIEFRRDGAERLAENFPIAHFQCPLFLLGRKQYPARFDEIPHLDRISKKFQLLRTENIFGEKNLYAGAPVFDMHEADLAHHPERSNPPDQYERRAVLCKSIKTIQRLLIGVGPLRFLRIDIVKHLRQTAQFHLLGGDDVLSQIFFHIQLIVDIFAGKDNNRASESTRSYRRNTCSLSKLSDGKNVVFHLAGRSRDLYGVTLLLADEFLAKRRFVGNFSNRWIHFVGTDDFKIHFFAADFDRQARTNTDRRRALLFSGHHGILEHPFKLGDTCLIFILLAFGFAVFGVLRKIALLFGFLDSVSDRLTHLTLAFIELSVQFFQTLLGKNSCHYFVFRK